MCVAFWSHMAATAPGITAKFKAGRGKKEGGRGVTVRVLGFFWFVFFCLSISKGERYPETDVCLRRLSHRPNRCVWWPCHPSCKGGWEREPRAEAGGLAEGGPDQLLSHGALNKIWAWRVRGQEGSPDLVTSSHTSEETEGREPLKDRPRVLSVLVPILEPQSRGQGFPKWPGPTRETIHRGH